MSTDKLADTIYTATSLGSLGAEIAARATREAFVVIDRNDLQAQVDTVMEYQGDSPYVGVKERVRRLKSGPAHVDVLAGAAHARDMAVHYLALAEWLDENPPVDEKAVAALANDLAVALDRDHARDLARRLVADGWKRGVTS